jgi:hypothetical protein
VVALCPDASVPVSWRQISCSLLSRSSGARRVRRR